MSRRGPGWKGVSLSLVVPMPVAYVEALSAAQSSDEVVQVCAAWLPKTLGIDRVTLTLLEGGRLVIGAGSEGREAASWRKLDLSTALSGKVAESRKVMIVRAPDAGGSPFVEDLFRRGYKTTMIVPMISNGSVMGTLNLSSRRADAFGEVDVRRAEAFGCWIASQLLIRQYARDMERLAMVDEMTGIPNRRAFLVEADARMTGFLRDGPGFSLVVFDIDHFKRVNDRFGHEAGDRVLQRAATLLREELPPDHLLARIGGEEFAILLPGGAIGAAIETAERCRAAIEAAVFRSGRRSLVVSASFGCAVAQVGDMAVSDVLRRADSALYAAKAAGRNRVCRAA